MWVCEFEKEKSETKKLKMPHALWHFFIACLQSRKYNNIALTHIVSAQS